MLDDPTIAHTIHVHDGELDVPPRGRYAHQRVFVAPSVVSDRRDRVALSDDEVELVLAVGEPLEKRLAEGEDARNSYRLRTERSRLRLYRVDTLSDAGTFACADVARPRQGSLPTPHFDLVTL